MNTTTETRAKLPSEGWLALLEVDPVTAVDQLLAGHSSLFPYSRADAPDAVRGLIGSSESDKHKWIKHLDRGMFGWLELKRKTVLPQERHRLQNVVRQVSEAFEIVSLLGLESSAGRLRNEFLRWHDWASAMVLSPARDAQAAYLLMLANTQGLCAGQMSNPDGLAPLWMSLCRDAGATQPNHYLQIALLGLRRLPSANNRGDRPWMAGVAAWAFEKDPTQIDFLRVWRPFKRLYPMVSNDYRTAVYSVLSQDQFRKHDIFPPKWWAYDPSFPKKSPSATHNLQPPSKNVWEDVLHRIDDGENFERLKPSLERIKNLYERFSDRTGDVYHLSRTFCNIGGHLLKVLDEALIERACFAETLARAAISYKPGHTHAWALWRQALFARGAFDASIILGWEVIRRFPSDAQHRNELAEQMLAVGRIDDALSLANSSHDSGVFDGATYSILCRISAHQGRFADAIAFAESGKRFNSSKQTLDSMLRELKSGQPPSLVATKLRDQLARRQQADKDVDHNLGGLVESGNLRALRHRLENADTAAVNEIQKILATDPNLSYARILAYRYGLSNEVNIEHLPFALALEAALSSEDIEKLDQLAQQEPRYDALVLLAKAILGDQESIDEVVHRLNSSSATVDNRVVNILRDRIRPVLDLLESGKSSNVVFLENVILLRRAVYDTNELINHSEFLAA